MARWSFQGIHSADHCQRCPETFLSAISWYCTAGERDVEPQKRGDLTEKLLETACKAATFAAEAAEQASELALDLSSLNPLAGAGDRTREAAAYIGAAIKDTLKST